MKKKNILVVVAHPDDEVLGCGGYISKYSKKFNIKTIILGEGSSCRSYKNLKELKKNIQIRQKASKKALSLLGSPRVDFYDNKCGNFRLANPVNVNKIIENEIRNFKPNIIFTHSKNDLNQDHRIVLESVLISCRPFKKNSFLEKIYSFEILSSSECSHLNQFNPNFFVKLSKKNIKNKTRAFNFFKTELMKKPLPRSSYGIELLARFRGLQCASEFSEAFFLVREFD